MKPINRKELVSRHNIHLTASDKRIPIGNGEFCFTADCTGLQTFGGNCMAHWAWHSFPVPKELDSERFPENGTYYHGRLTGDGADIYPADKSTERSYLFDNPHIFSLARLRFAAADGGMLSEEEFADSERELDLWNGILRTRFSFGGGNTGVVTCVHPDEDTTAVRITNDGLESELAAAVDFPYPSIEIGGNCCGDFSDESNDRHVSEVLFKGDNNCIIRRKIDDTNYTAELWISAGKIKQISPHTLMFLLPQNGDVEVVLRFSTSPHTDKVPSFSETSELCSAHYNDFWKSGGVIDLAESSDERWFELERRIVLSQYILAVQSAGSFPSAEAGLMNIDNWRGQFHMEMIWWHTAHYFLWNRAELADKQLSCYKKFLPTAKKLAEQLGYEGAKWGKSVCPKGRSAPWHGNLALLWKQPHPIFLAELEYRCRPNEATLGKWAEIIEETADHMVDYAVKRNDGYYHLDPVMPPSELGFTHDTVFDLAYWQWALDTANSWRVRMGKEKKEVWDDVARNLCPLPIMDGVYIRSPEWTDTYEKKNYEHPDPVGVYGMLPPTPLTDYEIAKASVKKVWGCWNRNAIWGWDFPWIAMCASRTDEPEIAVEAMMYVDIDEVGASGRGSYPYLPANGGILYAAAMMAVGHNGEAAPGFPSDGKWTVNCEGMLPW